MEWKRVKVAQTVVFCLRPSQLFNLPLSFSPSSNLSLYIKCSKNESWENSCPRSSVWRHNGQVPVQFTERHTSEYSVVPVPVLLSTKLARSADPSLDDRTMMRMVQPKSCWPKDYECHGIRRLYENVVSPSPFRWNRTSSGSWQTYKPHTLQKNMAWTKIVLWELCDSI